MSANKGQNARALVEPLALDSRTLGDSDLSALSLPHGSEQYTSNDFEEFANIQAEFECMNSEGVMTDDDQIIVERNDETDTMVPDVEMTEISEQVQAEHVYTMPSQNSQNIVFQTKPTLQRVPVSAVQMKPTIGQTTQSQSIMIVSPASGTGTSQILKISHPPTASAEQLQSLAQTLITGKSADGSVVQLRTTQPAKSIATTSASGNITISNMQNVKISQPTLKRATQNVSQGRNVYTKMILTGSQPQPGTQQVIITSSQSENQPTQGIKFLNNTSSSYGSPSKNITLAQMGIISTNKQHILPASSPKQGMILNKLLQSSTSQPSKVTIVPTSTAKSPPKILPAPIISLQAKSSTTTNQQPTFITTKSSTQQNPQKVIISRQGSLKPGNVLGSGQVIRIPASQNIVTGSNQVQQIQMSGRQVQYVRLVSTPSTGSTNVVTVGKSKASTTLQTVGIGQKIGNQQQIVKVVPLNTGSQSLRTVVPKTTLTTSTGQKVLIPAASAATATVGGQSKNAVAIPASALSQLASGQAVLSTNPVGNIVVLPAQYIQQQGKPGTNLGFHLSNTHPTEFTKHQFKKLNYRRKKSGTDHEDNKRCKLDKLLKQCVNLVTIHGRPFSLINDFSFRNIIEMISLESKERCFINAHKVRELVVSDAESIRNNIRHKINGKLVSLKLDAATCMGRSFLGVNVQFLSNNLILTICTVAVQELHGSHDAKALKNVVLNICEKYGISISQIYSITTDNGSNMIKLVRLLECIYHSGECEVGTDETDIVNITWDEDEDEIFLEDANNVEEDEETDVSVLGEDLQPTATTKYIVKSARCITHALHLAIADALKNHEIAQTIEIARRVCRKLRTSTIQDVLKAMKKKKPILDRITRWYSTLDMIERLIELKYYIDDPSSTNLDLYLTPEIWNKLKSIVASLVPARIATKKLQEQHLIIGDFYHVWTLCMLETSKINTTLAIELVDAMKRRQTQLFQNNIFLAGMFLDLRYNVVLSPQQTALAKEHLVKTWNQLIKIEALNQNNVPSTSHYKNSDSELNEFKSFMKELEQKKKKKEESPSLSVDIRNHLNSFSLLPRLKSSESILHYWKKNQNSMPELYKLAIIALAVPSTQLSVGRLFSSLKYILSLHCNLHDDIISDILLIRTNAEKNYKIIKK